MPQFQGLFTALITPFDSKGNVDFKAFRDQVHFQMENRVDGVVVLGTTGEAPTLSEEEKFKLIAIAREETKDKIPLMVGTGSYSTLQTIENTKLAEKLGADAALVISPYYNKPTQEGLFNHFKEISNAVSIPLILYNNPGRCGVGLDVATIERLAEIPNIIGIKEVSGNLERLHSLFDPLRAKLPGFMIFSGDDSTAFAFMTLGGHGLISVASNLIPDQMKTFVDICLSSRISEARKRHFELLPLFSALNIETNPIPIKTTMNLSGLNTGPCRLPLTEMQPENKLRLEKVLNKMNIATLQPADIHG